MPVVIIEEDLQDQGGLDPIKQQMPKRKIQDVNTNHDLFQKLSTLYRNPSFPGAFASKDVFFKHAKKQLPNLKRKHINEWEEHDLLIAKRSRKKKPKVRRSVVTYNPQQIWEGDLVDMKDTNIRLNRNVRYLLLMVDQFSKTLYCQPVMKGTKAAPEVVKAFKRIFENTTPRPKAIYSDRGSEFLAGVAKSYLNKEQGIQTWETKDKDIKASIVERYIRTLKGRIHTMIDGGNPKYIDHLQQIVSGINQTANRTTKIPASQVDPINVSDVRRNIYSYNQKQESKLRSLQTFKLNDKNKPPVPMYNIGDYVLIKREKKTFTKEHRGLWNDEIFKISNVSTETKPYTYHVQDLGNSPIGGYLNEAELKRIQLPTYFKLEKTTKFNRKVFTGLDKQKCIHLKVLEYHKPVSIPLKVFKEESKSGKGILARTFIFYLHHQLQQEAKQDGFDQENH